MSLRRARWERGLQTRRAQPKVVREGGAVRLRLWGVASFPPPTILFFMCDLRILSKTLQKSNSFHVHRYKRPGRKEKSSSATRYNPKVIADWLAQKHLTT